MFNASSLMILHGVDEKGTAKAKMAERLQVGCIQCRRSNGFLQTTHSVFAAESLIGVIFGGLYLRCLGK